MEAAVFGGPGVLTIEDRPPPEIADPADVLIEVEACGICGTDVQILSVPPGHPAREGTVLGHEIVGRVVEIGQESGPAAPGRRVVIDPDIRCNVCERCRSGDPANCLSIRALGVDEDGGLARYCVVPSRIVYPISEDTDPRSAALTEPLACVLNGTRRILPRPGESALIFGGGPIGALFLQVLRAGGVAPIGVVDPIGTRREAMRSLGVESAFDGTEGDLREVIRDSWGERPGIVVDAAGSALSEAVSVVADGGRILLFGMNDRAAEPIRQVDITRRELSIMGSYISRYTFAEAVSLIERGVVEGDGVVSHDMPLSDLKVGLDLVRTGEAMKVLIRP
jgi:threonine dehydrogenase-like Zn-dependent dehydrogenase